MRASRPPIVGPIAQPALTITRLSVSAVGPRCGGTLASTAAMLPGRNASLSNPSTKVPAAIVGTDANCVIAPIHAAAIVSVSNCTRMGPSTSASLPPTRLPIVDPTP